VSQDRLAEKAFIAGIGVGVAPHVDLTSAADLEAALAEHGAGIVKTRRLGYDGKGQVRVRPGEDTAEAVAVLRGAPSIFEAMVPFVREISVIVTRSLTGEVVCFDPGENVHRDGILHTTTLPAAISEETAAAAVAIATQIVDAFEYVGVMGVELFVLEDGTLLVNEVAPRVHNSGHWTIEACVVDQFQQHVRAIVGWPLGDGRRHSDVVMTNLIGDEVDGWHDLAATPGGGRAPLRQGCVAAGTQDGARHAAALIRRSHAVRVDQRWSTSSDLTEATRSARGWRSSCRFGSHSGSRLKASQATTTSTAAASPSSQ